MENFVNYMAQTEESELPSQSELEKIAHKYPFFTASKILLNKAYGGRGKLYEILQKVNVVPLASALEIGSKEFNKRSTIDIIDQFLSKGEYKITPNASTPEGDVSETNGAVEDDEILSEELAEIMLSQGLTEQAKQMYVKLSLLYPKKSVYFAEIISKIDDNK